MSLLEINDLKVTFRTNDGPVNAVNGVSFNIDKGPVRFGDRPSSTRIAWPLIPPSSHSRHREKHPGRGCDAAIFDFPQAGRFVARGRLGLVWPEQVGR